MLWCSAPKGSHVKKAYSNTIYENPKSLIYIYHTKEDLYVVPYYHALTWIVMLIFNMQQPASLLNIWPNMLQNLNLQNILIL